MPKSSLGEIIEKLQRNDPSFTEIHLRGCDISNKEIRRLSDALSKNRTVHTLELESNQLSSEGACAIAFLPQPGKRVGLVWSAPTELANTLLDLSDDEFLKRLQEAFGFRLGRFVAIEKRFSYPLQMLCAKKTAVDGCFLLGNAANTLHPIAAQGFNLGLRDAYELAALYQEGVLDDDLVKKYRDKRQADQKRTREFTHRLVRVFEIDNPVFSIFRSVGSFLIDYIPPLKHLIAGLTTKAQ